MFEDPAGPIEDFEWGRFVIRGKVHAEDGQGVGKDIFLLGDAVYPWEERVGHTLQPEMVACIQEKGVQVLVIGNGVNGRIRVPKRTRKRIRKYGVEILIVEKTPAACEIYNQFYRAGEAVALLAHGTC